MAIRILLVEDEERVRGFIQKALEEAGMKVDAIENLEFFESMMLSYHYDLVILDRLIRSSDSVHQIPSIRAQFPKLKILVLSALSEVQQRIQGLDNGADDYLGKPFHIEELVARVRSLTRRMSEEVKFENANFLKVGTLHIELDSQRVRKGSDPIHLTLQEFRLLVVLASNPKRVFTRSELLERVWGSQFEPESNVVDVTVGRLRKKINSEDSHSFVFPRRGVGYSLCESYESVE